MVAPSTFAIILLWWSFDGASTSPLMGPADIIIKFSEKCNVTLPTFVNFTMRVVTRRGKTVMNVTTTLPFKYSDKIGFEVSVAVKRNGAWTPNFFKTKGGKACTGLKSVQKELFELMAKALKAPQPYNCPLPAGSYSLINYYPDMNSFQSLLGSAMPYGEFKASVNITHKADQISCQLYYIDIVPKSAKKKGK